MRDSAPVGTHHRIIFVVGDIRDTQQRTGGGAVTDHVNVRAGLESAKAVLITDERHGGFVCSVIHTFVFCC